MQLVINNALLVAPEKPEPRAIFVHDGKIVSVEPCSELSFPGGEPDRELDAQGMYVFPGGIDPHVHMHLPTAAGYSSDDFITGSRAALFGGTTTIIDFVTPRRDQMLLQALEERKNEVNGSFTDYSFHISPVSWRSTLPEEITDCVRAGITSFKVYLAYKDTIGIEDEVLLNLMRAVARAGGLLTMHAELGDDIDVLRSTLFAAGQTGPSAHALSRPPETEVLAVAKAIGIAGMANCPIYFVHVSTRGAIELIRKAQKQGQAVYAEVCPHHLLLDDSRYGGDFISAAPFVLSPPLRSPKDREALWEALAEGSIQTSGTDHCPFMMQQKLLGLHDFRKIPNGAGGVEHRLSLLYTYGVAEKRISLQRFVDAVSVQPAKLFGLFPRKGSLQAGADADLVIWDPDVVHAITAGTHHQHCDHNIYEGFRVKGSPAYVIKGGQVVVENGVHNETAAGQFLVRQ